MLCFSKLSYAFIMTQLRITKGINTTTKAKTINYSKLKQRLCTTPNPYSSCFLCFTAAIYSALNAIKRPTQNF